MNTKIYEGVAFTNDPTEEKQEPYSRTFYDVIEELEMNDREIVFDKINDSDQETKSAKNQLEYFKNIVKKYFDISDFPLEKTSDELSELNEIKNTILINLKYDL